MWCHPGGAGNRCSAGQQSNSSLATARAARAQTSRHSTAAGQQGAARAGWMVRRAPAVLLRAVPAGGLLCLLPTWKCTSAPAHSATRPGRPEPQPCKARQARQARLLGLTRAAGAQAGSRQQAWACAIVAGKQARRPCSALTSSITLLPGPKVKPDDAESPGPSSCCCCCCCCCCASAAGGWACCSPCRCACWALPPRTCVARYWAKSTPPSQVLKPPSYTPGAQRKKQGQPAARFTTLHGHFSVSRCAQACPAPASVLNPRGGGPACQAALPPHPR